MKLESMGFTQCKNHQTVSQKKEFPTIPSEYLVKNSLKKTGGQEKNKMPMEVGVVTIEKPAGFMIIYQLD